MKKLFPVSLFLISCLIAETGFPAFDVFSSSAELGLGGAGFLNPSPISAKINPAVADSGRLFSTSIIRFPASITSQNAGLSLPWKSGVGSISVRHISYGTFEGYDSDFQSTGTYQSGDSWLKVGFAKPMSRLPIRYGTTAQYFSSTLKEHQIKALLFSFGSVLTLHRFRAKFGVSFHQVGKMFGGEILANGSIKTKTVLSGSKQLIHLPLTLFLDTIFEKNTAEPEVFLGGNFKLKNGLQIRWGTSSRKLDHNTKQDFLRSTLGASGFGIGFISGATSINYGAFIFGSGASVHGLDIGIKF